MVPYQELVKLGEGAFGQVFRAKETETGRIVALKFIEKDGRSYQEIRLLKREMAIMSKIHHPNIVALFSCFQMKKYLVFVMEYAGGSNLLQALHDRGTFPEHQVQNFACQLLSAFHYLHSRHIIHRDVKTANTVLGDDGVVKLCDFGFARVLRKPTSKLTYRMGTAAFMSPERIRGEPYDHTADLWALGCTLFELHTGELPFYSESRPQLMQLILEGSVEWPNNMSPSCKSFLRGLLTRDPVERLSWPLILTHPFVVGGVHHLDEDGDEEEDDRPEFEDSNETSDSDETSEEESDEDDDEISEEDEDEDSEEDKDEESEEDDDEDSEEDKDEDSEEDEDEESEEDDDEDSEEDDDEDSEEDEDEDSEEDEDEDSEDTSDEESDEASQHPQLENLVGDGDEGSGDRRMKLNNLRWIRKKLGLRSTTDRTREDRLQALSLKTDMQILHLKMKKEIEAMREDAAMKERSLRRETENLRVTLKACVGKLAADLQVERRKNALLEKELQEVRLREEVRNRSEAALEVAETHQVELHTEVGLQQDEVREENLDLERMQQSLDHGRTSREGEETVPTAPEPLEDAAVPEVKKRSFWKTAGICLGLTLIPVAVAALIVRR